MKNFIWWIKCLKELTKFIAYIAKNISSFKYLPIVINFWPEINICGNIFFKICFVEYTIIFEILYKTVVQSLAFSSSIMKVGVWHLCNYILCNLREHRKASLWNNFWNYRVFIVRKMWIGLAIRKLFSCHHFGKGRV